MVIITAFSFLACIAESVAPKCRMQTSVSRVDNSEHCTGLHRQSGGKGSVICRESNQRHHFSGISENLLGNSAKVGY